jgi:hypothetical protein
MQKRAGRALKISKHKDMTDRRFGCDSAATEDVNRHPAPSSTALKIEA